MLLSVDKLSVTLRGRPGLSDVSLSLNRGDRLVVLGQSGAGKSLLLDAITGQLDPGATVSGTVTLAPDGALGPHLGKRVAVVRADAETAFDPLRPIAEQIGAGTADLLKENGLDAGLGNKFPGEIARGDLRRIAIAAALAAKPELLIVDDPCAGLDALCTRGIVELIRRATASNEMALLFTCHDLKLAAELATRVLVLGAGKTVESGSLPDVFGRPRQDLTRRIMTAARARSKTLMRAPIGGQLLDVRKLGLTAKRDLALGRTPAPRVVLEDIDLSLRLGESLALTGAAGSGKTSLLRLIAGLGLATRGEIEFDHQTYRGSDMPTPLRREVGLVFTDPRTSFNPRLAVGESIAEPLRLESLKPLDELSDRIVEMVRAVGFAPEVMVRPPSDFTLGQLQRLALARALVTRPRLVMLDDPFRHLDVLARGDLLAMLMRLRADFGLTLIIAAHDFETLKLLADRVVVLNKGHIVETSTPAMLLEKPQQELTRQLVAAALPDVGIVPVF